MDEPAFGLVLVLLGRLPLPEHVLGIRVELVSLIAVGRLARDRVVVRLVGRDDPAILAEGRVLEEIVIVAGVIDAGRNEDGGAPVVVQERLETEGNT